jgi:pimeloyl-ACP methyl ester carboxylesterase
VWSARHWVGTRFESPVLEAARRLNAWGGRGAPPAGAGTLAFMRRRWQAAGHLSLPVLSATLRGIYDPGLTGRLDAIAVPTLVIAGRWDVTAPPTGARALAAAIPGATLHVVPRATHHPMAEAPDAFAEVVRSFAGQIPLVATS